MSNYHNNNMYFDPRYTAIHNGYRIQANADLLCDPKILNTIVEGTEKYISTHNRTFIVLFILRYPLDGQCVYHEDNRQMQAFMDRFKKYLEYHNYDPHYIWVREQKRSEHHHYHCILMLNGRNIQNPGKIMAQATHIWGSIISRNAEGLIHYRDGSYMLRRDDDKFSERKRFVVYRESYLAKINTKDLTPSRIRRIGYSHI